MPIDHLLNQRCSVSRLSQVNVDGRPSYNWTEVLDGVKCRLDLGQSIVPRWDPQTGRAPDRRGTMFMAAPADPEAIPKPGDRFTITKITGVVNMPDRQLVGSQWQVDGFPYPAQGMVVDHLELEVVEVAPSVAVPQ